jgi:hypothetical protein
VSVLCVRERVREKMRGRESDTEMRPGSLMVARQDTVRTFQVETEKKIMQKNTGMGLGSLVVNREDTVCTFKVDQVPGISLHERS